MSTCAVGILINAFLLWLFALPRRRLIILAVTAVNLALPVLVGNFDRHSLLMMRFSIGTGLALVLWAAWLGRPARWLMLAGVLACFAPTVATGYRYADRYFFLGFVAMVLAFLVQVVRNYTRTQRERQEARVRRDALKYELLRKTIQPHFLMNSI